MRGALRIDIRIYQKIDTIALQPEATRIPSNYASGAHSEDLPVAFYAKDVFVHAFGFSVFCHGALVPKGSFEETRVALKLGNQVAWNSSFV